MKNESKKAIISLILNALTILLTLKSVIGYFVTTGDGNMAVAGTRCFRYFTIDSNILAALSSAVIIPYNIKIIQDEETEIPKYASLFKFVGTISVMLTFLTVIFFLGPTQGYAVMFEGDCLWLHLVCPIMCLVSYFFFEGTYIPKLSETFLGIIPTLVYGTVYLIMVIFIGTGNGGWEDFYGFNIGGIWYVSYIAMMIVTYMICWALSKGKEKLSAVIK